MQKFIMLITFLMQSSINSLSPEAAFTHIFKTHYWPFRESLSGSGSDLVETIEIREAIPDLLGKLNIKSMLDAACGDFNWTAKINLPCEKYIGVDIIKELIIKNNQLYCDRQREFIYMDLYRMVPQKVDLILCRDCLVHHPYKSAQQIISNFKKSGSTYLLATTFPLMMTNIDIKQIGFDWRN